MVSAVKKSSFIKLIALQIRIIHALLLREILTKFGTRKLGYLWVIAETMIQVAIFAGIKYILGIFIIKGIHFVLFLVTGIVPFFYFKNTVTKTMGAIRSNKGLLTLAQINFFDLFYARFVLETATYLTIFILSILFTHIFIIDVGIDDLIGLLYCFFLLGFLGFGLGLIFSVFSSLFDSFKVLISLLMRVLYYTSGILFSIELIPEEFRELLSWNPILNIIESLRNAFFIDYSATETFLNLEYALNVALFLNLIGFLLVSRMKKWLIK